MLINDIVLDYGNILIDDLKKRGDYIPVCYRLGDDCSRSMNIDYRFSYGSVLLDNCISCNLRVQFFGRFHYSCRCVYSSNGSFYYCGDSKNKVLLTDFEEYILQKYSGDVSRFAKFSDFFSNVVISGVYDVVENSNYFTGKVRLGIDSFKCLNCFRRFGNRIETMMYINFSYVGLKLIFFKGGFCHFDNNLINIKRVLGG